MKEREREDEEKRMEEEEKKKEEVKEKRGGEIGQSREASGEHYSGSSTTTIAILTAIRPLFLRVFLFYYYCSY